MTHASNLGLAMGSAHVASIGHSDDIALLNENIHSLQCLVHLAMEYVEKSFVEMVPEKNKLLCFTPRGQVMVSYYWSVARPVSLGGYCISFTDKA